MRVEEKQIDGPDLERQEEQQETLLAERQEGELPHLAGEEVHDVGPSRHAQLVEAMQAILADKQLSISSLRLPKREARALEALQAAVTGRTTNIDQFVYASDRRTLLEQALAVLQPNLTGGDQKHVAAIQEHVNHLTKRVTELRHHLMNLEDGQDDLMQDRAVTTKAEAPGDTPVDTTDKPKPDLSLDGPERKVEKAPTTLLAGPEVKVEKVATTLTGPEVKVEKVATTLTGPEVKEPAKPETSLGEAAEIAAARKKLPWWRRPLG